MIRKDYILRIIDELVRVLQRVFNLKDLRAYEEALALLRRESDRLLGIDGGMMEVLAPTDIRKALRAPELGLVAGRILEEMALVYDATGEPGRATVLGVKALDLYAGTLEVDPAAVDADYRARVSGLADAVAQRPLAPADWRVLMRAYEQTGAFARAEDMLYEALDEDVDRERVVAEGRAFYGRLLGKTDEELEAGGLPRGEVEEGMKGLPSS